MPRRRRHEPLRRLRMQTCTCLSCSQAGAALKIKHFFVVVVEATRPNPAPQKRPTSSPCGGCHSPPEGVLPFLDHTRNFDSHQTSRAAPSAPPRGAAAQLWSHVVWRDLGHCSSDTSDHPAPCSHLLLARLLGSPPHSLAATPRYTLYAVSERALLGKIQAQSGQTSQPPRPRSSEKH